MRKRLIVCAFCAFVSLSVFAQEKSVVETGVTLIPIDSSVMFFGPGSYARAIRLSDGSHIMAYESGHGSVSVASTVDDGATWTRTVVFPSYHADGTGVSACNAEILELSDGTLLCACNYRPHKEGFEPFSIAVSRSFDKGITWENPVILYKADSYFKNGCWEPCPRQLPTGQLQIYFANESPYRNSKEQEISMLWSDDNGASWSETPKTVSFRRGHRDGMPVMEIFDDEMVVVIEDNNIGEFKPCTVRCKLDDNWSTPVLGKSAQRDYALIDGMPASSYLGAPYIVKLPNGQAVISYQTNHGRIGEWEKSCMEIAIGDTHARNFKVVCRPFDVPLESSGLWNSLCVWDDNTLMAISSIDGFIVTKRYRIAISNPVDVAMGDPFVLLASDGHYYMYGTTAADGFKAYRSDDLSKWEDIGKVYDGNQTGSWTKDCYWAPEVFEHQGKYYMFFSANCKDNPNGELEIFRIGVAVSDSPAGPFINMYDKPIFDPGYPIIDADVLFQDDGRCYLYYSRCCYKHAVDSEIAQRMLSEGKFSEIEESWVYGVEMKPDFSGVIGEPVVLLRPPFSMDDPQNEWESRSVTCGEANRRWTEGSLIFKKDDIYYMMYSSNFYMGENYALGYASSDSPLGPFVKSENNPVLEKNTSKGGDVTGVGHNSVTYSRDGKHMFCVYHGRTTQTGNDRVVFIDEMLVKDGKLEILGPTTAQYH